MSKSIQNLYVQTIPSRRSGALYSAFSYPTKISPETIAVLIASHTNPGDTVLDVFGGSGTTGLATHLCSNPTEEVLELAKKMNAPVKWGSRKAIVYELSVLGSFIGTVMNNPPIHTEFEKEAKNLIERSSKKLKDIYTVLDDNGGKGTIRYTIWTDVIICAKCKNESTFWKEIVSFNPLNINSTFTCPSCKHQEKASIIEKVFEKKIDPVSGNIKEIKKRLPCRIYGQTGNRKWSREATELDYKNSEKFNNLLSSLNIPNIEIPWGDLYRSGYHKGITDLHHFYTNRNLITLASLWNEVDNSPEHLQSALKLLILSYNASHSTLMTRVVVKQNQNDFVITGAQPGVLYISSLPVEKNIFLGLKRKIKTFSTSFRIVNNSKSIVSVINSSSTKLDLEDNSIDYIFTDPPFGDYIPYSELNFFNEAWLEKITDNTNEVIINKSQGKDLKKYKNLMSDVFREMYRVLKDDSKSTVVFHSAKANIWHALQSSYRSAGFEVELSNVLDKLQSSFKQTNSNIKVQGDPLLLLTKQKKIFDEEVSWEPIDILTKLLNEARMNNDKKEFSKERLYSRFINKFLSNGREVPLDAKCFYSLVEKVIR